MNKLCIALIAASLLVAGCNRTGPRFVGTWSGQMVLSEDDIENYGELEDGKYLEDKVQGVANMDSTIELRGNGTYTMTIKGNSFQDTWDLLEDRLVLKSSGPIEDPERRGRLIGNGSAMILTITEDGKQFYMPDPSGKLTSRIVFSRQ